MKTSWTGSALDAHCERKSSHAGLTLDNFPSDEGMEELCRRTGKMLLLYTAPLLIEEYAVWHPTIYPADLYPTVPVTFEVVGRSTEIITDFDTGAADTYVDAAMLQNQGIIHITLAPRRRESHLGQDFWFTIKRVEVALTGVDGSRRSTVLNVL